MNYPSWYFLGDEVSGCISDRNFISSWMLRFLPSNVMWSLHTYNYDRVYAAHHHFLLLITFNKGYYNHVIHYYVVYFILSTEPWLTTTTSLHGDVKVIKKKVGDICWFCQGSIFINSHMFTWMLFIFRFYYNESDDADRVLFGYSKK